jgi:maleamate amidohydrolase
MTDTYKAIGFDANRVGFGERPGIAVVDFQKGFTLPEFPLGGRPMVTRAVENSAKLLKAARAANLPVATCYTAYTSRRDMPYWKVAPVLSDFTHGNLSTVLDDRIYEPGYDAVFCKTGPSIFFQTAITSFFIKERVDTVIVVGCNTSGCVRASINDAFSYGYRVIVPEPCVGDVEEGPHRDNLRDVGRRYADVVGLDEVLDYVEQVRRRNTPS